MTRPPPSSTLFPNTPLFQSQSPAALRHRRQIGSHRADLHFLRRRWRAGEIFGNLGLGLGLGLGLWSFHWFQLDRKSTRLNSSHSQISYAVFCLKKKMKSIRALATAAGGSLVLMAGPDDFRHDVGAWGTPPATLNLMRRLRYAFDPNQVTKSGSF